MKFNVYLVAGLALIIFGLALPMLMATYVADDTPPELLNKIPDVSGVYSPAALSRLWASVRDSQSGIKTVTCKIDSSNYVLTFSQSYADGSEEWISPSYVPASGTHIITWTVTNNVDLATTATGSFTVYTALTGDWYINNVLITASSQKVYGSLTAQFKFVKSAGLDDSIIQCFIYEGATKLLTLTNSAAKTWTGTYTFTSGTHSLQLKATDGYSTVTMATVDFGQPLSITIPWLTPGNIMAICGACLMGFGLYTQKKRLGRN